MHYQSILLNQKEFRIHFGIYLRCGYIVKRVKRCLGTGYGIPGFIVIGTDRYLTGYGRDGLGELSLLGFSYAQNHNPGVIFIAYAGAQQMKKVSGSKAPIFAAVREGQRLGRKAAKLAHEDVAKLMQEPLDAARERLGIGKPEIYRECLRIFESEGLSTQDPGVAPVEAPDCCAA